GTSIFPTHVGVFLPLARLEGSWTDFPHARGGVSRIGSGVMAWGQFSPRTWGCFGRNFDRLRLPFIFPTHVGVFLCNRQKGPIIRNFPHARGGVSTVLGVDAAGAQFSPRTWGCF